MSGWRSSSSSQKRLWRGGGVCHHVVYKVYTQLRLTWIQENTYTVPSVWLVTSVVTSYFFPHLGITCCCTIEDIEVKSILTSKVTWHLWFHLIFNVCVRTCVCAHVCGCVYKRVYTNNFLLSSYLLTKWW